MTLETLEEILSWSALAGAIGVAAAWLLYRDNKMVQWLLVGIVFMTIGGLAINIHLRDIVDVVWNVIGLVIYGYLLREWDYDD